MKDLFDLFLTFFRVGGLTFGGGYAMLPMLQKEVVEKKGWATEEEVMDYFAVGQCMPGIIATNTATFIGYKHRGIPGAIAAAFGVVVPSLVIITIIAMFLENVIDEPVVVRAFAGINVAVAALIVNAVIKLWKSGIKDWVGVIVCIAVFALTVFTKLSPIYFVLAAALTGIITGAVREKRRVDV